MNSLMQDLRYGVRMLIKNPGFSLVAIITLALGIGGNTSIFTITSALLLKPLPYQDPQRLVEIDTQRKDEGRANPGGFSLGRYEMIRDHAHSFSSVAVSTTDTMNLTGGGEPQQVSIMRVSGRFFDLLGVTPQIGRTFADDDDHPEGKPVVIISNALWHRRFGGNPAVIGQTINLDSLPYTIVGVLRVNAQFPFESPAEIWSPRYFEHTLMPTARLRLGVGYLTAIARLKPGATVKSAQAEMDVLSQQYIQQNLKAPDAGSNVSALVGNLQEQTVANIRPGLLVLSGAVGFVLLIACANVASLLLSRALARRKEIAVRTALGAQRGAIIRQLLTESVLLALAGGAVGLGFSYIATHYLATLGADNLPQGFPLTLDGRVLLFMLSISLLTGLVFGIFPALQLAGTNVIETLRDEGRGATGSHRRAELKSLLVIGQVAISMLLLVGAGLLVRSFSRLLNVDPGFDPRHVVTMNLSLPTVKYSKPEQQVAFFDDVLRRVATLPGVQAVSISAALPLTPKRLTPILPEGMPEKPLAERPFIIIEAISPRWFTTLHVPLRGRDFSAADKIGSPNVVIINEALARRFYPNQNPIGHHLVMGRQTASEIIGVAGDVKNSGLAQDPQVQLYFPFSQIPWGNMNLLLRTAADPHDMVASVRAQISAADADQPVTDIRTVDELMDNSRTQPRFAMFLLAIFSATAIVLAVVGIYGVLAYSVAQRRQELGVRMALGAKKSDILKLVVRQGVQLTAIGIVIGLIAAAALTRLMSSLLYKTDAWDATTFVMAPLIFLLIGSLASYLPARRAITVDPTEALR